MGCTLWTNFNLFGNPGIARHTATLEMTDYKKIRLSSVVFSKTTPCRHGRFTSQIVELVKRGNDKICREKRVIVTHHAPSKISIPHAHREQTVSAAYASHLDDFVAESGALLWIHGHLHTQKDYKIGNTRVICNPSDIPMNQITILCRIMVQ